MCYSPEVSFGTWGIAIISSIYLFAKRRQFLFPLVVSQMQLAEGLRWINAADDRSIAIFAKFVLLCQPIAALYESKLYSLILPYIAAQSLCTFAFGSNDFRFEVARDGHFEWKWIRGLFSIELAPYWIGLLIGTYTLIPLGLGLLLSSLFLFYYLNYAQYKTVGSLWCVSVNVMWIYYLFIK